MKKINLSIAIPAYNEEVTITNIVDAIKNQKGNTYNLVSVYIYNDGSNDSTLRVLKRLKKIFRKIVIKNFKTRRGKNYRLNQIFKRVNSEILIILDADINFYGNSYIDQLIKPIIADKKIVMSASLSKPLRPKNLLGKLVYQSFINWDYMKSYSNDTDSVHSFGGAATAYRKSFYKTLEIPKNTTEERLYIYHKAKRIEGFYLNKDSIIYFWPVSTFKDLINLTHREFGRANFELDKSIGINTNKSIKISLKYKLLGFLKAFLESPIYAPAALIINILIAHARPRKTNLNNFWEISKSTKIPIAFKNHI